MQQKPQRGERAQAGGEARSAVTPANGGDNNISPEGATENRGTKTSSVFPRTNSEFAVFFCDLAGYKCVLIYFS